MTANVRPHNRSSDTGHRRFHRQLDTINEVFRAHDMAVECVLFSETRYVIKGTNLRILCLLQQLTFSNFFNRIEFVRKIFNVTFQDHRRKSLIIHKSSKRRVQISENQRVFFDKELKYLTYSNTYHTFPVEIGEKIEIEETIDR